MHKSLVEVWLKRRELNFMVQEARHFAPNETGGVFMGYRTNNSVVITAVIAAGPDAVRTRNCYKPDLIYEQAEIAKIYHRSGRIHSYLGDWHTHPSGPLRLSRKDKEAMRVIAQDAEARAERPLMAILAGGKDDWGCSIWECCKGSIRLFSRISPAKLRLY
jgi:integrative and conjugative element protein (TIGR02256 family)